MCMWNNIIVTRQDTFTEQHRSGSQSPGAWVQIWALRPYPGTHSPPACGAQCHCLQNDSYALMASGSISPW